jgi:REP element-mobilizing transposase RayT
MPRPVRIQDEGAVYHVMCRGDRREAIFADDRDREMFLGTLGQMCARSGLRVHSYVLMSNHYYLLVETPEPNLVTGMKWFQDTYTQRFNARHPRVVQTYSLRRCHCRGKRPRASRRSAKSG